MAEWCRGASHSPRHQQHTTTICAELYGVVSGEPMKASLFLHNQYRVNTRHYVKVHFS
eukprot:SAG25_NODE_5062_length_708_cov_1.027915_1_plen_57_part_10